MAWRAVAGLIDEPEQAGIVCRGSGDYPVREPFVAGARHLRPDTSFAVAHQSLGGMAPDVDRRMSAALRNAGLE
jgi:hypothetical protein